MCPVFVCTDFNNIKSCKHYLCILKGVNINTVYVYSKNRIMSRSNEGSNMNYIKMKV